MVHTLKSKPVMVSLAVVASLVLAASAYAYFTSTGSGSGSASVASAGFTVRVSPARGEPLYPGTGNSQHLPFSIVNAGEGSQRLNSITASVKSSNDNITQDGIEVAGCLASWFTVTTPTVYGLPRTFAPGETFENPAMVSMVESETNQDACQGKNPEILIAVG